MRSIRLRSERNSHSYQRNLATSLVSSMGYNDAVALCYENGWHGVLDAVQRVGAVRRMSRRLSRRYSHRR